MKKKAVNISFNSLQEMSEWIEKTPRTERGEIYKSSIREGERGVNSQAQKLMPMQMHS